MQWLDHLIVDRYGVLANLPFFMPEVALTAVILTVIVFDLVPRRPMRTIPMVALTGLLLTFLLTLLAYWRLDQQSEAVGPLFLGMMSVDPMAFVFKLILIFAAIFAVFFSVHQRFVPYFGEGEYYTLLLSATLGGFFLSSASDLLMVYLSLEAVSVPCYLLAGFFRTSRRSSEAALKYILFGALASGAMLYGMSLLYGLTGTTNFAELHALLGSGAVAVEPVALLFISGLILVGFGYKIACVPFHMWCPDVYEGAPTPVTAFFSVAPKAAGFGVLIRFFYSVLTDRGGADWHAAGGVPWAALAAVVCVLTMTLGNLAALSQHNLKRLLAYSSIAHAGYILMGFVVMSPEGLRAMIFYLAVYLFMNLGAFLVVIIASEYTGGEEIWHFRGLGWRSPFLAVSMTIFLLSLTGMPPLAGFVGKVYLFAACVAEKWYWLALLGVLNSALSLYYYARILKAMFLEGMPEGPVPSLSISPYYTALLGVLVAPTIFFGIYWSPLIDFVELSTKF